MHVGRNRCSDISARPSFNLILIKRLPANPNRAFRLKLSARKPGSVAGSVGFRMLEILNSLGLPRGSVRVQEPRPIHGYIIATFRLTTQTSMCNSPWSFRSTEPAASAYSTLHHCDGSPHLPMRMVLKSLKLPPSQPSWCCRAHTLQLLKAAISPATPTCSSLLLLPAFFFCQDAQAPPTLGLSQLFLTPGWGGVFPRSS